MATKLPEKTGRDVGALLGVGGVGRARGSSGYQDKGDHVFVLCLIPRLIWARWLQE